jgi:cyclic pyranopterin phosphate synthase
MLTHIDEQGKASMVDVGVKDETSRKAIASAFVAMRPETLQSIEDNTIAKGDVLAVARTAGIMAAKRTSELIPLCHPLFLTKVAVEFEPINANERCGIALTALAQNVGRTGVEMEALTAASVAALTIYDMCKAIDRAMVIGEIRLEYKSGGKSGVFQRTDVNGVPTVSKGKGEDHV